MNVKKREKVILITIFFILCFFLYACNNNNSIDKDPEIKAVMTIAKLADEDFDKIGTSNVAKDDFRKISFLLNVNNCSNMTNRIISVPNLKEIMNNYDIERYWYGSGTYFEHPGEDAYYKYDIMFLSRGLAGDEEIKSVFADNQIKITWTNENDKEIENIIFISDIIEFTEEN